jgi:hypothetical protein
MSHMLIAKKDNAGRWQKVAIVRSTSRSLNLPEWMSGTLEGGLAKMAWNFFQAEPAACGLTWEQGGQEWRVDLIR